MRKFYFIFILVLISSCSISQAKNNLQDKYPNATIFTVNNGNVTNLAFLTKDGDFYYADYNGNRSTVNTLIFSANDNIIEQVAVDEGEISAITSALIKYHGNFFLYKVAERWGDNRQIFVLGADRSIWYYAFDGEELDERFNVTTLPATEETREPYIDFTKVNKE